MGVFGYEYLQPAIRRSASGSRSFGDAGVPDDVRVDSTRAIHLACAEVFGCQAFITCDDRLLKKAHMSDVRLMIFNPLTFLQEVKTDVDESNFVH